MHTLLPSVCSGRINIVIKREKKTDATKLVPKGTGHSWYLLKKIMSIKTYLLAINGETLI